MRTHRLSRRCRALVAVLTGTLALSGVAVLAGDAGGPKAKGDPDRAARLVAAIVTRNKEPMIVKRGAGVPEKVPLFPENYDWKEERRVRRALGELYRDTTPAVWEELVRRGQDQRYCIVVVNVQDESAMVWSVGGVCSWLAYDRLTNVYRRHMPHLDERHRLYLDVVGIKDLAEWRKQRAGKPLYQLQIEVCERALRELPKAKGVSKKSKDQARKDIEAEIANLKRTKRAVVAQSGGVFGGGYTTVHTPELAKRIREAVRTGSDENLATITK